MDTEEQSRDVQSMTTSGGQPIIQCHRDKITKQLHLHGTSALNSLIVVAVRKLTPNSKGYLNDPTFHAIGDSLRRDDEPWISDHPSVRRNTDRYPHPQVISRRTLCIVIKTDMYPHRDLPRRDGFKKNRRS